MACVRGLRHLVALESLRTVFKLSNSTGATTMTPRRDLVEGDPGQEHRAASPRNCALTDLKLLSDLSNLPRLGFAPGFRRVAARVSVLSCAKASIRQVRQYPTMDVDSLWADLVRQGLDASVFARV